MPTYIYRREDGSTFEVVQRITEEPLTVDPETGQKVQRVISGAGLIFKGEGFYLTDYARKKASGNGADKESKKATSESTDTKPAVEKPAVEKPAVEKPAETKAAA